MTAPADAAELRYSTPAGRRVLLAAVLGSGMAGLDATVVGIALPAIGRDFSAGVNALQWVFNAYTLTLAGLLLLGGALGDRYGRRRIFLLGTGWFTAASLLCGLAPNAGTLILARALQGVGAALLTPGSLAIVQSSFHDADRSRAIGAWSGLSGVATAAGPLVGGWLVGVASWRLVFLINLPVAVVLLLVTAKHVPESRGIPSERPLDWTGGVLVTAGLAGLTYALTDGTAAGWGSPRVLASLVAGLALLAVFVAVERGKAEPLLPLGLFRLAQFSAANGVTFLVYAALGGALFLLPVVLQQAAGYSPLLAGTALLPVTAIMLLLSPTSGAVAARIGPRLPMTVGPVVVAAGLTLLVRVDTGGSYLAQVLPAMVVFGLGLAINVAPLTATALAAVPPGHAGLASAINNDVARAGGLIAVAVLPPLAGITGTAYADPAALLDGFRLAVVIAAGACVLGAALAGAAIRNPLRPAAPAHGPQRPERPDRAAHCALDGTPLRPGRADDAAPGTAAAPLLEG